MQHISETWKRIVAWHAANTPGGTFCLADGATEAEVCSFESMIGSPLPEDIRESLLLHNGGEDAWLVHYGELLSLAGMTQQWHLYRQLREADPDGGLEPRCIEGPIKPVWWYPKRVHLTDNSGDHIMADCDPAGGGRYGQIIEHSHEIGPTKVLAWSWREFLAQLALKQASYRACAGG